MEDDAVRLTRGLHVGRLFTLDSCIKIRRLMRIRVFIQYKVASQRTYRASGTFVRRRFAMGAQGFEEMFAISMFCVVLWITGRILKMVGISPILGEIGMGLLLGPNGVSALLY